MAGCWNLEGGSMGFPNGQMPWIYECVYHFLISIKDNLHHIITHYRNIDLPIAGSKVTTLLLSYKVYSLILFQGTGNTAAHADHVGAGNTLIVKKPVNRFREFACLLTSRAQHTYSVHSCSSKNNCLLHIC